MNAVHACTGVSCCFAFMARKLEISNIETNSYTDTYFNDNIVICMKHHEEQKNITYRYKVKAIYT